MVANPYVAYASIILLQLKIMWGWWSCRDLESGDDSYYFTTAQMWFEQGRTAIVWSPLYTSFLGTLLHFNPDPHIALVTHRILIVTTLSALVLALMRRLMSPEIAWMIAAWWTILPINFNSLYEVHLFGTIPVLAAFLAIAHFEGARGRGLGLGLLLLTAVLLRNEVLPTVAIFATLALLAEFRSPQRLSWTRLSALYGIPILAVVALTIFFYGRAQDSGPKFRPALDRKHTLNVCQVYAAGYQQRHPEWNHSPWTECQSLMTERFGRPQPTMVQALAANPKAMLEHYTWNASLIPNGLQVLLLDATSGTVNPDYASVNLWTLWAAFGSLGLLSIVLAAAYRIRDRWKLWYRDHITPRRWVWLAMFSGTPVAVFVMLTQRPRPSYLFAFGVLLMAIVGLALEILLSGRTAKTLVALVSIVSPLAVPSYSQWKPCPPQTLLTLYRFLQPHAAELRGGVKIMTSGYGEDLCAYLGNAGEGLCTAIAYSAIKPRLQGNSDLISILNEEKVDYVLTDLAMTDDPAVQDFLRSNGGNGWTLLSTGTPEAQPLNLLKRSSSR